MTVNQRLKHSVFTGSIISPIFKTVPITNQRTETGVFQLKNDSASRLDGFPASFSQHLSYGRLQTDLTNTVLSFFNRGYLLRELNQTHIYLIPKLNNSESFEDYKPISLCNVAYKIIAKVIANRLKPITPYQNAFVRDRLI